MALEEIALSDAIRLERQTEAGGKLINQCVSALRCNKAARIEYITVLLLVELSLFLHDSSCPKRHSCAATMTEAFF